MDCSLSGSSVCAIFQARVLEWNAISFSRGSSWPRNRTQVSGIAGRCLTIWATREAQEYWMGSLFLLQVIFLTQESNPGLPQCKQNLHHLSYQASPISIEDLLNLGVEECSNRTQAASGNRSKNHSLSVPQLVFHPRHYFPSLQPQGRSSPWVQWPITIKIIVS